MRVLAAHLAMGLTMLAASPASAVGSRSANFQNLRSAFDSAGSSATSTGYSHVNTVGIPATSNLSAPSFTSRSGLIPTYFFPGRIEDMVAFGCQDSKITLQWTAPGNDGQAPGSRARSFLIRYGDDPALSPARSETLFYSAATVAPPTPEVRGSTHRLTVGGLTNGVTYYFAILALEADLMAGPLSPGTTSASGSGNGPAPDGFVGASGFKRSELYWAATAGVPGDCAPVAYRISRSLDPSGAFAVLGDTVGVRFSDIGVVAGATYYYKLVGLDISDAEMTAAASTYLYVHGAPPTPPLRPELALFASSVTVRWEVPIAYAIGIPFADPARAQPDELNAFVVWRSTRLMNAQWEVLAQLSSTTLTYSDLAPVAGAYYHVTAHNITDTSPPSWVRDLAAQDGFAVSPDLRSHLHVPKATLASVYASPAAYWVGTGSGTPSAQNGVYNEAGWAIMDRDGMPHKHYRFPGAVDVRVSYEVNAGGQLQAMGVAASSAKPLAGGQPHSESDAILYWYNGIEFVKIFGRVDSASKWVSASTERGGLYQVRAINRLAVADFDLSNVSNRFLTPNGDGRNDNVVFRFDNPRDTRVTGKIFDVKGRLVTTLIQKTQFSMEWDGTVNGRPVPLGVYIYQLQGDGKTNNGTLVVVK